MAEVSVTPPVAVVRPDADIQLSATARSQAGETVAATLAWSSSDPGVALVDDAGRVQGVADGSVWIVARSGTAADSARIMVGVPPRIRLSQGTLGITRVKGKDPAQTIRVEITNGGEIALDQLSVRVAYEGAQGWLTATMDRTAAPASVSLRADPAGLPEATHRATVLVEAPLAENSPMALPVTLEVVGIPEIRVQPGSVALGIESPARDVAVTNAGGGTLAQLSVQVAYSGASGWLSASLNREAAPATLRLEAAPTGLASGTYQAVITVRSGVEDVDAVLLPVTVTVPEAPARPSQLDADERSSNSIRLTWKDRSSNESEFQIQRRRGLGSWQSVATVGANVSQWTDTGLDSDVVYTYRVRACHVWTCSTWSRSASARTDD